MTILAIDPGLSGAWAVFEDGSLTEAGDLPTVGDASQRRLNSWEFIATVNRVRPDMVIIEDVSAMPGQGVSSMFRFGRVCGAIEGVVACANAPLQRVTAGKWKRHFALQGKGDGGAEASRQKAIERFPSHAALFARKKDHNRAEAALIGLWFVSQPQNQRSTGGTRGSEAGHSFLETRTGGG